MISRTILTPLFAMGLGLAASSAQAIPLMDLFDGGDITVGDKLFDNWQLIYEEGGGEGGIDFSQIEVTGLNTDPMNIGLSYAGNGQLAAFGPEDFLDLSFSFDVTVLNPDYQINGASLEITETEFGGEGGIVQVLESVSDNGGGDYVLDTFDDNLNGIDQLMDAVAFGALAAVSVITDIFAFPDFGDDSVELVSFEQHFSQTKSGVSEPSTLLLIGLGLVSIGVMRRRRQAQRV